MVNAAWAFAIIVAITLLQVRAEYAAVVVFEVFVVHGGMAFASLPNGAARAVERLPSARMAASGLARFPDP